MYLGDLFALYLGALAVYLGARVHCLVWQARSRLGRGRVLLFLTRFVFSLRRFDKSILDLAVCGFSLAVERQVRHPPGCFRLACLCAQMAVRFSLAHMAFCCRAVARLAVCSVQISTCFGTYE